MNAVEVAPDEGAWKVTVLAGPSEQSATSRVLSRRRRKKSAMLVGTGAAMALRCELRVKNKRGEYTTEGASFGGDPRRYRG